MSKKAEDSSVEKLKEFLAKKIVAPIALLPNLIYEGGSGMISGDTGVGKTWFVLQIAYAVAAKKLIWPWGVGNGIPVLYVDGESGEALFRLRLMLTKNRDNDEETRELADLNFNLLGRVWCSEEFSDIDTISGQKYIEKYIENCKPKLIIFDNMESLCPDAISSNKAFTCLIKWLNALNARGIATILVHHNNKNGTQYGSSKKTRQMHYVLSLTKTDEPRTETETTFFLNVVKQRDAGIPLDKDFRFVIKTKMNEKQWPEVLCTEVKHEKLFSNTENRDEEIRACLKEGLSGKVIAEKFNISESTVSRIKRSMTKYVFD